MKAILSRTSIGRISRVQIDVMKVCLIPKRYRLNKNLALLCKRLHFFEIYFVFDASKKAKKTAWSYFCSTVSCAITISNLGAFFNSNCFGHPGVVAVLRRSHQGLVRSTCRIYAKFKSWIQFLIDSRVIPYFPLRHPLE